MADVAYAQDPAELDQEPQDGADVVPLRPQAHPLLARIDSPNIAEDLDANTLAGIGARVVEDYDIDLISRKTEGWEDRHDRALKLAMLVKEAKSYPWPKASSVKYPLITTAAIQFNARAYPAIVDGPNVVKGKVLGKPTDEKRARAERVGRHMSYQLLEEEAEWEGDTDRLLVILPVTGTVFRKRYFDPIKQRTCSEIITADKYVVNYWATGDCPRGTQLLSLYPHQVEERIRAGIWLKIELGIAPDAGNDREAPHDFLEQNRLWDLDDDGYPEPYCITVHKESGKVVRIKARFEREGVTLTQSGQVVRIEPMKYVTKYSFIPSLDGSYYDIGLGLLLEALNETVNSTINQLMDAGHLANTQGGFIGDGVSIKSGALRFAPGEWKKVSATGAALKDSIVSLPTREPSPVLFQLLGLLIEAGKEIASTKDILTGDTGKGQQPVGTTLAMIEQGLKVYTAIIKRVHRAFKEELGVLFSLNRTYLNPEVYYTFQDEEGAVSQEDYASKDVDVRPVSDPTMATDMQRLGRAQFIGQFIGNPVVDQPVLVERMLESANVQDAKELMAKPTGPPPEAIAQAAQLDLKQREVETKERDVAIRAAQAKADIAATLATALQTLSQLGRPKTPAPASGLPGSSPAPLVPALAPEIDPAIAHAMDGLMAIAEREIGDAAVRSGDLPGLAGPPANPDVPAVPQGPAGGVGPQMDGGEPIPTPGEVGGTDQGLADGGAGGPPLA